MKERAKLVKE